MNRLGDGGRARGAAGNRFIRLSKWSIALMVDLLGITCGGGGRDGGVDVIVGICRVV